MSEDSQTQDIVVPWIWFILEKGSKAKSAKTKDTQGKVREARQKLPELSPSRVTKDILNSPSNVL